MGPASARGAAAVVGVGTTPQGLFPGTSAEDHAVEAVRRALADAGIHKSQVDGLITCKTFSNSNVDMVVGQRLGINPRYSASLDYGTCNFSMHLATMVLLAGLAETIVVVYGTDQGTRNTGALSKSVSPIGMDDQLAAWCALMFERHRQRYGLTEEQLGHVSVSQRRWAQLNPLAIRREPLTIEQYLQAPYRINPIRAYDICPMDDGGAAVVLTTADRAADLAVKPVYILGMAQGASLRLDQNADNLDREWNRAVADRVFAAAGIDRSDIDLVSIQDPASMWTVQMLGQYGFVPPEDVGAFFAEGHTGPGGSLPVNTSGGHLSESYMWGWLHIAEIIRQLRGNCGDRQVLGAATAIHCSTRSDVKGAATIYGTLR